MTTAVDKWPACARTVAGPYGGPLTHSSYTTPGDTTAYCKPENKVSLGFVERLNNKIRVFQRRAYGLKDEEYLRLKVLSCMLPVL